jgi:AraC family transcriptional regulator of adaptative response/methylated-DNA-[protein]-cysteine methyltransferase
MLFALPDDDTLYAALIERDPRYEGRVFVGVTSTGIFCRLTCPARKPKPENCRFFETVAECLEAGFRPCKRCHPLGPAAEGEPVIQTLLTALEARPDHRWREEDIVALGLDPSTARRAFRRQYGLTFLEMARLTRLRNGFGTLAEGGRVIDAQLDAQFDSASGFRVAFAKLMGRAPQDFTGQEMLQAAWLETPLGPMIAVCDDTHLHLLEFVDRRALPKELAKLRRLVKDDIGLGRTQACDQTEAELAAFFAGDRASFSVPLVLHGTPFQREVWRALQEIPAGDTCTYGDLAQALGHPTATRAVARANGANQIALIVPCHRVIGADGSLTGYGGGLWRKQQLIALEQHYV